MLVSQSKPAPSWLTSLSTSKSKFLATFKWTLIGCTLGAAAVVYFGPMLIVFGMFAAGTASMVVRELLLAAQRDNHTTPEERSWKGGLS